MPVTPQIRELLLQSLEHELGGVLIYQTALECARNDDLVKEWREYLDQTQHHVEVLTGTCVDLGLDPDEMTPGRKVVQHNGKGLVMAMKMALAASDPAAAELVACECVVLAETKDHFDWQLIGECAKAIGGDVGAALRRSRGRGGRAPVPHQGLVPRAMAPVAGPSRTAASGRGAPRRPLGSRGGRSRAGSQALAADEASSLRRQGPSVVRKTLGSRLRGNDLHAHHPFATCRSGLLSKNCSSSVECLSAVVDAWLPCTVVVTASK